MPSIISTLFIAINLFDVLISTGAIDDRSVFQLKESHTQPRKWRRVCQAPSDQIINLRIGLRQGKFEELQRHLQEGTRFASFTVVAVD